ncbi:hypothetical protein ACFQ06_13095, partial [Tessaracoccus lubricantis]
QRAGRGALDMLLCENLHDAPGVLRRALDAAHGGDTTSLVGLSATSIGRMIPRASGEDADLTGVAVEPYAQLPYDAAALRGNAPDVPGLVPIRENFEAYADRKLYVHNMGHCMLAYLAHRKSLRYVWEAVADLELRYLVRAAMLESAAAVSRVHGMEPGPLQHHVNDLLHRFTNRELGDTAQRVGQDPVRKMQPDDRLIGAYLLCKRAQVPFLHVSLGVALGAHQLETEAGWPASEVEAHLERHLFQDSERDDGARRLLADQLQLVREGAPLVEQIARIDAEYLEPWVV